MRNKKNNKIEAEWTRTHVYNKPPGPDGTYYTDTKEWDAVKQSLGWKSANGPVDWSDL